MVHERHEAERGRIGQREKKILHPGIGHFTAQVQQVFGPELPGGAATVQRAYGLAEHGDTAFVVVLAHGQGVKNGRDPGRDDLGVMGKKGGHALRPEHFGARDEMLFEVVGVKLHKAGHQVVAFQIDAFRERARAVVERDDAPVADDEGAFDNRVGGDQPGVGEYGFVHGCMLLMKKGYGRLTGMVRSATASRATSSWKMPTMAGPVPARFADQIDDHLPVRAVQRGRGLVEQENGGRADEAARDGSPAAARRRKTWRARCATGVRAGSAGQAALRRGWRRRPALRPPQAAAPRPDPSVLTRGITRRNWLT